MKRYYLSKIKQIEVPSVGLVWTHRMAEAHPSVEQLNYEIAVDSLTGAPVAPAVLVLVGGVNHARFRDDPEIVPMPNVAHDVKVSAVQTKVKLKAKADIKALGFSDTQIADAWDNADGMRDVLNKYGRVNRPSFDVDDFDLDES